MCLFALVKSSKKQNKNNTEIKEEKVVYRCIGVL